MTRPPIVHRTRHLSSYRVCFGFSSSALQTGMKIKSYYFMHLFQFSGGNVALERL